MTLIELLFALLSLALAAVGAWLGHHLGLPAAILGGLAGLFTPFLLGRIVTAIDEHFYARTDAGKFRLRVEATFDRLHPERQRLATLRPRPRPGRHGSLIATIYYQDPAPPGRSFFQQGPDGEPTEIPLAEAAKHISVHPQ